MAKKVKKTTPKPTAVKKAPAKKIVKKIVKKVSMPVKAQKEKAQKTTKVVPQQQERVVVKSNAEDLKPLAKSEFGEFKAKLLALKEEILNQIKEISEDNLMKSQTEATGENSSYTLDAATDNYDREFNFRLVSGDRELLLEIDAALKKLEGSDYGICVICDQQIGRNRLSVIPYAIHCRQCKEQLEKEGKL